MLPSKDTTILSELKDFFTSDEKALDTIFRITSSLSLSKNKFIQTEQNNNTYLNCDKLVLLLLFPFFKIKDTFHYKESPLHKVVSCGKDVFYRLLNNEDMDWRGLNYSISKRLVKRIGKEGATGTQGKEVPPRCLIVDDTDFPKTGEQIELMGKVFSHVGHKCLLGFKGLFMAYHDGKSLLALDFSLHGEKGKNKKKPYGLSFSKLKERFAKKRRTDSPGKERHREYFTSKIDNMITMLRTAIKNDIRFDYLLVDSWFTCHKLLNFIKTRRIDCHLLGMIKMGTTKYLYEGKLLTANQILDKLKRGKKIKRSKATRFYYGEAVVEFKGKEAKLIFSKATKRGKWHGLMTTDMELKFDRALQIYSTRWAIEVFFKESKQHLGIGKCESRDFDAQIAHTTICMMQYNILSVAKRIESYETIGGLFREANADSLEITISERIWMILLEIVKEFSEIFDIDLQEFMEKMASDNEQITKLLKIRSLIQAA